MKGSLLSRLRWVSVSRGMNPSCNTADSTSGFLLGLASKGSVHRGHLV